ncbi:hypothetical protein RBB50_001443 [Rhinocladiella similis]
MSLTRNTMSPLRSHDPLLFASKSDEQPDMSWRTASRLNFVASWKLNSEAGREEPRLRNLLGHLSMYEGTRTATRPEKAPAESADSNELSAYIQQHVPSFQDFQTAIALQLAAIAEIQAKASQPREENDSDDEGEEDDDDDDDYESGDGTWSDNETAAESDDSYTDYEISDGQWSPCSSPTSSLGELEDEEEDRAGLWAIRPPASTFAGHSKILC